MAKVDCDDCGKGIADTEKDPIRVSLNGMRVICTSCWKTEGKRENERLDRLQREYDRG